MLDVIYRLGAHVNLFSIIHKFDQRRNPLKIPIRFNKIEYRRDNPRFRRPRIPNTIDYPKPLSNALHAVRPIYMDNQLIWKMIHYPYKKD